MSDRTAIQATIKRATAVAQRAMDALDSSSLNELKALYEQAAADIRDRIKVHAGADDNLALQELQSLLAQVNGRLNTLAQSRDAMLDGKMAEAADLGVRPFADSPSINVAAAMRINDEAVRFVRSFVAEDGLQLSDRIWRLDRHAREVVTGAIEQAVIQGHGAAQAAHEFMARGEAVPIEIQNKLGAANAAKLGEAAAGALLTGSGTPLDNAMRLFRTEINRAHGEAYIKGAFEHPDAAGVRFLLSPAHPEHDICDLHASANLHGLGTGVYPNRETCPWPAHPNTLSYVEVVFKDEVTEDDKQGKETPIQALDRLTPAQQRGVLGAHKHEAFKEGKLTQGMIKAPWKSVRARIQKMPAKPVVRKPAKPRNMDLDDMVSAGGEIADRLLQGSTPQSFLETLHADLKSARPMMTPAKVENGGKGADLVRAASQMYPDDWTKRADSIGPLYAKFSTGRGYQISLPKEMAGRRVKTKGLGLITARGGEGFISTGGFSTSVHEYAHRLQHAIPELDEYFQALHGRRTASDPLRRLRDLYPGYGYAKDEVAREDKYINAYQGRIYSGAGHAYLGRHGALEVMTMAFEDVLGGSAARLEAMIQKDREMFNLVIGLLYHYVP